MQHFSIWGRQDMQSLQKIEVLEAEARASDVHKNWFLAEGHWMSVTETERKYGFVFLTKFICQTLHSATLDNSF